VNLSGLGGGGAASSSQDQGLPDRFDLNKTFNDWSGSTAGIFGELGKAPAKFAETPFSFGHQLVTRAASFIPGGSDALQAAGSAVAPVAGFAGDVMNRVSNFVPALINSEDANLFKAIGDLPGNTPLSPEVLLQHGIAPKIENTGGWWGLGALGITGHVKTVDEFKSELMKRGFFSDATGQSIDPNGLLQQLRGGRSVYDFGSKAINDNPLVDMAGRLATDPSNALFLIPGAGLVKGAALATKGAEAAKMGAEGGNIGMRVLEMVGRVVPRSRLIEAGAIAPKLPSPIIAAEALARGLTSMGTLKGAGLFLKEGATSGSRLGLSVLRTATDVPGYLRAAEGATGLAKTVSRARSFTRASTALGATNLAFNRLSNTANNLLGGNVPILKDIAQFSADVENDRPLSNNSAWMLASAIAFPYGEVAGEIKAKVSGSAIYTVDLKIVPVDKARWRSICTDCSGSIDSLVELLQGRLSKGVMERICRQETGLFPSPAEIKLSCSCPDWADMCKHAAAVLYGVGARLDRQRDGAGVAVDDGLGLELRQGDGVHVGRVTRQRADLIRGQCAVVDPHVAHLALEVPVG